ncbi:MAG TPA: nuclear transport factor 2 family protein [Steroidobacteraceae bacterium]|nr:nuclear transport factor 2 family protein [Steroidobacteraceae bacterium]
MNSPVRKQVLASTAAGFTALALTALQPAVAAGAPKLSTMDYIEITQLANRYVWAIDVCSNAGKDYADLYTPDGVFAVSDEWGGGGKRTFVTTGHDALAKVAGGRDGKCVDPKSSPGYGISHLSVDLVITPTATGATGKSILLAIGVGGDPTRIERQGGYDDVFVKTAGVWRIKSRTHVWPNMAESAMFKKFEKQLTAPTSSSTPAPDAKTPTPAK